MPFSSKRRKKASGAFEKVLLVIAITFGTINVIGGFFVTDRMLEMFKRKEPPKADDDAEAAKGPQQ